MSNVPTLLLRAGIACALMLLTPLTFATSTSSPGLAENAACARGEDGPPCKPEVESVCTYGGSTVYDHYLDN